MGAGHLEDEEEEDTEDEELGFEHGAEDDGVDDAGGGGYPVLRQNHVLFGQQYGVAGLLHVGFGSGHLLEEEDDDFEELEEGFDEDFDELADETED